MKFLNLEYEYFLFIYEDWNWIRNPENLSDKLYHIQIIIFFRNLIFRRKIYREIRDFSMIDEFKSF